MGAGCASIALPAPKFFFLIYKDAPLAGVRMREPVNPMGMLA
jgi:hypothetical protein